MVFFFCHFSWLHPGATERQALPMTRMLGDANLLFMRAKEAGWRTYEIDASFDAY